MVQLFNIIFLTLISKIYKKKNKILDTFIYYVVLKKTNNLILENLF